MEELAERIIYSDRYSDDKFEYRHVILPKAMLKYIPKSYFSSDDSGLLRILEENEWRGIGITQSLGWEHFEVHAPEPHICELLSHSQPLLTDGVDSLSNS
ncbi:cyclin-dependent kinase regulatory subunit [Kwoniella mangroviensis CBS 8886]|nr:cyclin-dependent kinase regulatory subunit [Kwoniella mangroviensis CBS 8886]